MKVFIIGQGYVGLSIAAAAASAGHQVVGFDINHERIQKLSKSISHIEGISDENLRELSGSEKLLFSNDPSLMADSDVIIVAVPTPLDSNRQPDLTFVHNAVDSIIENAVSSALIVNESTSFPGTLRDEIAARIALKSDIAHEFASAPERVDPGNPSFNVKNTPRVVSGLSDKASASVSDFYSSFCDYVTVVSSPEVAETAKLLENTFRQVNIALVNQMALITEKLGISIHDVVEAAATKPFGYMKFTPGLGVGGHCIPVDPTYLLHTAKKAGVPATFIELANQVNEEMGQKIISIVESRIGGSLIGKSVCVVGITYKSDVADLRESPSVNLITQLRSKGSIVKWHDNLVKKWNGEESSDVASDDIVIVAVAHSDLDRQKLLSAKYVFDCTGKLSEFDTF
jgi:UDP-N-acetyl-D-glucosamine dehydrogenase